ncbi:hypothetical protein ACWEPC_53045, partial [Nonomuraea sp. NPDC004297]
MNGAERPGPPGPAEAGGAEGFVRSLVLLRRWAGEPSLSRLRSLGGQTAASDGTMVDALPKSTTSHVLRQGGRLPRWEFVRAFVTACLRSCDHPPELIPGELERWRAARATLAGLAAPTLPGPGEAGPARAEQEATAPAWPEPGEAGPARAGQEATAPARPELGEAASALPEVEEAALAPPSPGAGGPSGSEVPGSAPPGSAPSGSGASGSGAAGLGVGERAATVAVRADGPDPAVELLVRRVVREEDRARKGLLGGYDIAPVSFGPVPHAARPG